MPWIQFVPSDCVRPMKNQIQCCMVNSLCSSVMVIKIWILKDVCGCLYTFHLLNYLAEGSLSEGYFRKAVALNSTGTCSGILQMACSLVMITLLSISEQGKHTHTELIVYADLSSSGVLLCVNYVKHEYFRVQIARYIPVPPLKPVL